MKKKVFTLIIVIPIILLIAYLLKNPISRYFIAPVLSASRIGSILFETVPQYFWWGIFIFILGVVAVRSLLGGRRPKSLDVEITNEERMSRARLWSRWIEMSHRGNYSKWLLARHFADLATNVLIYQERQSLERIQERIMSDENVIPPDIRSYLQVGLNMPSFRHYSEYLGDKSWLHLPSLKSISHFVRRMLHRRDLPNHISTLDTINTLPAGNELPADNLLHAGNLLPPSPLQIDPEVIIHFLESKIPTGGSA